MSRAYVEFAEKLASLSLDEYYDVLSSNGFDSWESILGIDENDMERLGFKRGHRRKLFRAIATDQGFSTSQPLTDASTPKDYSVTSSLSEDRRKDSSEGPPTKRTCRHSPESERSSPTRQEEQAEPAIFIDFPSDVSGKYE
jgi:hypothetical protein